MKILTIILIMVASLIAGYVIAQYNRGSIRLYSLSASEGVFKPLTPSAPHASITTYSFEMNNLSAKHSYISDEKPKYSIKATKFPKLFSYLLIPLFSN